MRYQTLSVMLAIVVTLMGCVSANTHKGTVAELDAARQESADAAAEHEAFKQAAERTKQDLEAQLAGSRSERDQLQSVSDQLEAERNQLRDTRAQLQTEVLELQDQSADLRARLEAEQAQAASLREDKQRLLAGTTTAQEEIERMQERIGTLEVEEARARDLEKRLAGRSAELSELRKKNGMLEGDLQAKTSESQSLEQQLSDREAQLAELRQVAADRHELARTVESLTQEREQLTSALRQEKQRLEAEEAEKQRLEQERAAKEEEVRRLTQTHEDLRTSLEDEIAKGDIRIQQVRDRLTINMVDRVLFSSGQAQVKPSGLTVLKQVSDVLKDVPGKQIRIEGHTDNVPIGHKLRNRFPTNWELSTARATSVVRYLIEKGEVDPSTISAVGYSDTQPIASNDTEEGRRSNRRIEIVLYPRDLSEIAGGMENGSVAHHSGVR